MKKPKKQVTRELKIEKGILKFKSKRSNYFSGFVERDRLPSGTMGKWSKYPQLYKKEWENLEILKGWLEQRGEKGHCKFCKADLRPHLSDLKKHATSQKHLKIVQSRRGTSKTVFSTFQEPKELTEEMKTKKFELQIALYIATKSSFLAVDDLCEILQNKFGKNAIRHII